MILKLTFYVAINLDEMIRNYNNIFQFQDKYSWSQYWKEINIISCPPIGERIYDDVEPRSDTTVLRKELAGAIAWRKEWRRRRGGDTAAGQTTWAFHFLLPLRDVRIWELDLVLFICILQNIHYKIFNISRQHWSRMLFRSRLRHFSFLGLFKSGVLKLLVPGKISRGSRGPRTLFFRFVSTDWQPLAV